MTRTEDLSETEITSEMIEAGLEELYKFPIMDPWEENLREAVIHVFRAMQKARPPVVL
jgi:hypothetical protein